MASALALSMKPQVLMMMQSASESSGVVVWPSLRRAWQNTSAST